MNKIFYALSICILGFELLACGDPIDPLKEANTGTDTTGKSLKPGTGSNGGTTDGIQKKTIQQAFAEVVQVLHAPYKDDTDKLFFKIFTGTDKTTQNSAGEGSGTWTVKAGAEKEAGAAKDNKIVYEYKDYQPKGSPIIVNGKMVAMTRTEGAGAGGDAVDAIGFNEAGGTALTAASIGGSSNTFDQAKSTAAKAAGIGTLVEPLNITGAYDATLTFTYTAHGIHSDVTVAKYDSYLFGERGMFTKAGSKVEFTYDGNTIELNEEQLEALLRVS